MYQLKYLSCFVKLSPTSPFKLNQAQNSKYNTTKEFKLWQSIQTKQIVQFIVLLFLNYKNKIGHLKEKKFNNSPEICKCNIRNI